MPVIKSTATAISVEGRSNELHKLQVSADTSNLPSGGELSKSLVQVQKLGMNRNSRIRMKGQLGNTALLHKIPIFVLARRQLNICVQNG